MSSTSAASATATSVAKITASKPYSPRPTLLHNSRCSATQPSSPKQAPPSSRPYPLPLLVPKLLRQAFLIRQGRILQLSMRASELPSFLRLGLLGSETQRMGSSDRRGTGDRLLGGERACMHHERRSSGVAAAATPRARLAVNSGSAQHAHLEPSPERRGQRHSLLGDGLGL